MCEREKAKFQKKREKGKERNKKRKESEKLRKRNIARPPDYLSKKQNCAKSNQDHEHVDGDVVLSSKGLYFKG